MIESAIAFDFGKVTIIDNILIAELNEGILFDVENNRKLLKLGNKIFKGMPYGYISNRVNSYAVNPMIYLESSSTINLKAIAVVSNNPVCQQNTLLEKQFYKEEDSFEVFDTLEAAINWIKLKI
ncbi:MAG: hypothetical protein ACQEWG_00890 [Bacteroidota bacterium]